MRWLLFLLILIVVAVLIALATGFLDVSQNRPARAPDVRVANSGVSTNGGQAPTFDIETGTVAVGSRQANVTVPTIEVNPPGGSNRQQGGDRPANGNRTADGA